MSLTHFVLTTVKPLKMLHFVLLLSSLVISFSLFAETYEEGKQAYLSKNYQRALEILKPLAENGNSQAQITLGLMYDYGQGVKKDPGESLKWYRMAAEQGEPLVQHDIGVKYFKGQGVDQDYSEAAKWWEMSANAGVADSQFNLGLMYYRGIGLAKDYDKASVLFKQAAEQGHGHAQYSLAVMYAFGQSNIKDYEIALKWFRKSAEQNVAQAQFNLGVFYENGYGVKKDTKEARNWYQAASDQGLKEATEKLKTLKEETVEVAATEEPELQKQDMETEPEMTATVTGKVTPPATSGKELNLSNWLREQHPKTYIIQLASIINENDIIEYIQESGLGPKAGYVEVIVNEIPRYTAVYGLYDTYKNAELAISELPLEIQKAKPWVRNIGILQGFLR